MTHGKTILNLPSQLIGLETILVYVHFVLEVLLMYIIYVHFILCQNKIDIFTQTCTLTYLFFFFLFFDDI